MCVRFGVPLGSYWCALLAADIWTDAGATTLAYKGVAEEMKRNEPAAWQGSAKQRQDVRELNRNGPEPPKQTFDKPTFVLDDGARKVEFHFFGWAHTRGDGFVYLPKEDVYRCPAGERLKYYF